MKNYNIEIKWAIRFSLLMLAWAIGEKLTGLHDAHIANYWIYTNLFAIPALLFYSLALIEKKQSFFNGNISWKQGVVSGIVLSFLIAILNPIVQVVIYNSISPQFFENIIEYKTKHSHMSLETAKAYFNLKSYLIQTTFTNLSLGTITGALVSYFIKSKH